MDTKARTQTDNTPLSAMSAVVTRNRTEHEVTEEGKDLS